MPRIPQHIIDRVIQETDIVGVIGESVPLKKAGGDYKALCPFHQEKTPSFVVSPQKQIYHCFGCGQGGNVISFLMQSEKLDFVSTIRRLGKELGISVPTGNDPVQQKFYDLCFNANSHAHWFFRQNFSQSKKARAYVKSRFLSPDAVEHFELGYAPEDAAGLWKFLEEKKVSLDAVIKLGLVKKRDDGSLYDFFRDRLMFPIRNRQGNIVGFGGRDLSGRSPAKYLNSPEGPVYQKSRELYGLYEGKKQVLQKGQVIIVEGYLDVLACWQMGLKNAVAPLGTSLTQQQARVLRGLARQCILLFDGDVAGKKASLKAIQTCFELGAHPQLILLPPEKDPADFLRHSALADEFFKYARHPVFAMDWILTGYQKKATLKPQQRARYIARIMEWLDHLPNEVEKWQYERKLSEYFDFSESERRGLFGRTTPPVNEVEGNVPSLTLEENLVSLALSYPGWIRQGELYELAAHFNSHPLKNLVQFLCDFLKKHETFNQELAIHAVPEELKGVFAKLLLGNKGPLDESDIQLSAQKFRQKIKRERLKKLTTQIVEAEIKGDTALKQKLLGEKQELLR